MGRAAPVPGPSGDNGRKVIEGVWLLALIGREPGRVVACRRVAVLRTGAHVQPSPGPYQQGRVNYSYQPNAPAPRTCLVP